MRVVLTGTAQDRLAESLRAEGFVVHRRPLVRIERVDRPPIRAGEYDWLLLTSGNAVEPLLDRLEGLLPRVAVIGRATAEALRDHGVEPDLVAAVSTQEGLAAELPRPVGRVLFAGAEGARDILARELRADYVALYRTVEVARAELPDADLAIVASPSAARALARVRPDLPCVTIGPVTSSAAEAVGLQVLAEADSQDGEGLLAAVKLAASQRDSSLS